MKSSLRIVLTGLLTAFVIFIAACGSNNANEASESSAAPTAKESKAAAPSASASSVEPAKEKVVTIGIVNSPVTLNQIDDQGDSASTTVISLLNDALLDINSSYEFVPKLATSVETKDNQNFVIKLDPNAKWNDGQPFTTSDVQFTLNTALHSKVSTSFKLSFVEGVNDAGKLEEGQTELSGLKIVDGQTFEIKTKTPIDPNIFKESLTKVYFLPEHILKDVPVDQLATHPYFQKPEVTIGPFKYANFAKDQFVEVVRNENYYRPVAKLNKIFVKVLPAANLTVQLQTGDIHMNSLPVGLIPLQDLEKVKGLPNVTVDSSGPSEPAELYFNNGTLNSPKVRQAIAYSLNRQLIVDQLLKGQAEVIDGRVPSDNPYFDKDIQPYTYDPEKAKSLLKESGWDAKKEIRFLIPVGNKVREQAADVLVQNLKDVGFNIKVEKYDFATLSGLIDKKAYDITIFNWDYYIEPNLYFSLYHSKNENNFIQYNNPKVDQLIEEGVTESDIARRHEIYSEIQKIVHEDLPTLSVYSEKRLQAVSKDVLVGKPLNLGMFNNVNEWDLK